MTWFIQIFTESRENYFALIFFGYCSGVRFFTEKSRFARSVSVPPHFNFLSCSKNFKYSRPSFSRSSLESIFSNSISEKSVFGFSASVLVTASASFCLAKAKSASRRAIAMILSSSGSKK